MSATATASTIAEALGAATASGARAESKRFDGDREAVRRQACDHALQLLLEAASAL